MADPKHSPTDPQPPAAKPAAEPPKLVTCDLRLSGKGVPGFPFRQFTDKAELPADKAKKLVEFWQKLLGE